MQHENTVENLLQLQLSSDALAVRYLPSILSILSPAHFSSDSNESFSSQAGSGTNKFDNAAHTQMAPMIPALLNKWCMRVMSLMQSKDAGARWAGICLAKKTGELRRDVVLEYAQRWINLTLPPLSRAEPLPIWKASIDLLVFVFVVTSHLSEFRRQVSTPTVPKLSNALLELSGKADEPLKLLIFDSLATLVTKFPTIHRSLAAQITSITIPVLAGSFPHAYSVSLVRAAAHLLASMHYTEGKVGGPLAWRNTLDSVTHKAWECINTVQCSSVKDIPPNFTPKKVMEFPEVSGDPLVAIHVLLSRLNSMILVIEALFRINPSRPVLVPISTLTDIAIRLLRSTNHTPISQPQEDVVRAQLKRQSVPELVRAGEKLTGVLVTSLRQNMTPHATPVLSSLAYQLEQDIPVATRCHLLRSLALCLDYIISHAPFLPARLFHAVVPSLSPLLPNKRAISSAPSINSDIQAQGGKKGKGRKRIRDFEGDESLTSGDRGSSMTSDEASVILQALEVLQRVLRMPSLPASLHSLGTRLILSLHVHVTNHPPSGVGFVLADSDNSFHAKLQAKLVELQGELSLGTAGYSWRGMNLTMKLLTNGDEDTLVSNATSSTARVLDALIHPRLPPPTLRKLPAPESLMLFNREEPREEQEERMALRLEDGTGLGIDVEVQEGPTHEPHPSAQGNKPASRPVQDEDRVDDGHAMEIEILSAKSSLAPAIAQTTPSPRAPPAVDAVVDARVEKVTSTPTIFGGFGGNAMPFEEKDANPSPLTMAVHQTLIETGAPALFKPPGTTKEPFFGMTDMSDDEPIPSIDMGSDSD